MSNKKVHNDVERQWFSSLAVGDEVWWNDPDHGIASGYYRITWIDDGEITINTVVRLSKGTGDAEAYVMELSPTQPEDLYPVVNGHWSYPDFLGYARSREEAIAVGNATSADEIVDAYIGENVKVGEGATEPKAWVLMLKDQHPSLCRLRLTLDVTYDLNGESANIMKHRLYRMVERAIGEGLLTGNTKAEVDQYSMDVTEFPEVDEEAMIDFFAQQMEDGQIRPSNVARRFVQYGLMDPAEFAIEMQERMEMAEEEDEA